MIQWHGVQRPSKPGDPTSPKLWYPQWVQRSVVDTARKAKRIAQRTSHDESDIKAILDAAQEDEIDTFLDSDASKWDGLWIVSLKVTSPSPGVATPEELNDIKKEADVIIRVAPQIRDALDRAKFQRVE